MRLLTSSSTNRWKAAEIQLHSSTQARVLTHLKCFVLRERGYSQELCSLGQNFSMYCPSQSLHLFLLPGLPFQPVFPSLQSGFIVLLLQVELASFPGIWRGPSPGLVQGQEAAGSAGTCPPGLLGTGSGGWWCLGAAGSYGKRVGASGKLSWCPALLYGFQEMLCSGGAVSLGNGFWSCC